jgi:hypothetical protein
MAGYKRNKHRNTFLSTERRQYQKQEGHHPTKNTQARSVASLPSHPFAAREARQASEDLLKILLAVSVISVIDLRKHTLSSIHICVNPVQLCAQIELS